MGLQRAIDLVLTAEIADGAIINANVAAGAAIALTKMAIDLSNVVLGVAAGYRVARGTVVVDGVDGEIEVDTGLTAIEAAVAIPRADIVGTDMWISCTWAAGALTLKLWQPTTLDGGGLGDATPVFATGGLQVDWIAVGT